MGMDATLASLCLLIGFVYIIVPGPIFFSLMGLIAHRGKRSGCRLIAGCLLGDLGWTVIAMTSLISSSLLDPRLFLALNAACGAYLIWLAIKALRATGGTHNETLNTRRPLRRGIALGVFNPKSYPVLMSLLAGFIGPYLQAPSWMQALAIFGWIAASMIGTYGLFVLACALPLIKRMFLQHTVLVSRLVGLLFLFFGASLLTKLAENLLS